LFGKVHGFLSSVLESPSDRQCVGQGNAATKLDLTLATGKQLDLALITSLENRTLQSARSAINYLLTFQCFAPGWTHRRRKGGMARRTGRARAASNHASLHPFEHFTPDAGSEPPGNHFRKPPHPESVTDSYDRWLGRSPRGSCRWKSVRQRARPKLDPNHLGRLVSVKPSYSSDRRGFSIILSCAMSSYNPIFPAFRDSTATVISRKWTGAILSASTNRSLWRQWRRFRSGGQADADATSVPLAFERPSETLSGDQ